MSQVRDINSVSIFEPFILTAPIIQQLLLEDCAISICDSNEVIAYFPGKALNQKVSPGDPLIPSSGVGRAIATGHRISIRVGAELFGVPYIVTAIPIKDKDDCIIGGISLSMSVEKEERMFEIAQEMHGYVEGVRKVVQDLNVRAAHLDQLEHQWKEQVIQTNAITEQSEQLTLTIRKIAKETEILALNSGIEAARQGEHGRVFQVVAQRMRNLAEQVHQSVNQINNNFAAIGKANKQLHDQLHHLEQISAQIELTSKRLENQIDEVKAIVEKFVALDDRNDG